MNEGQLLTLGIVLAIVGAVVIKELLCWWRNNAVYRAKEDAYQRGRAHGYHNAKREFGLTDDRPKRAHLLSWARWAERGCPDCKASLFRSWFGMKRGVLVFEFNCGAMWTNENGGKRTVEGIDCAANIERAAEREAANA